MPKLFTIKMRVIRKLSRSFFSSLSWLLKIIFILKSINIMNLFFVYSVHIHLKMFASCQQDHRHIQLKFLNEKKRKLSSLMILFAYSSLQRIIGYWTLGSQRSGWATFPTILLGGRRKCLKLFVSVKQNSKGAKLKIRRA